MSTSLIVILIVLAVLIVWMVSMYNGFISRVNRAKEALSDIDVQMKRRYDLIPNLVEAVKGYASHEKDVFEKVTKARTVAMGASSTQEKSKAENALSGTLKSLFAVAEAYPDLKANQNFLQLQRELGDTEDKIQASRRFYNSNVRDLNIAIGKFPDNIMAKMFHFSPMDLFELSDTDEEAKEPVKVQF
ncbi:LemA protein [hydrothermal vent metagenome]|uniref:LemA protein n=1 Tax=hydrothermal vent metagenome TaxID=652676 RepID=A0A3B0V312_9ZZZZ